MRHLRQCRWLAGFVLLAACSSESGPVETDTNDTADELARPFNLEDEELAYDAKVNGVLSEDEMRGALATLAANGIPREQVEFRGRIAFLEGDMMVDADELLAPKTADGSIEKGYTFNTTAKLSSGFQGCAPYQCGEFAPTVYSRIQGGQFQFLRPDTEHMYYMVVVPRPAGEISAQRMATLHSQLASAGGRIIGASANDCLNITMTVLSQAEYNALANPFGTQHHIITVQPYTTNGTFAHTCGPGAIACANLPGDRGIRNDSKVLSTGKHRFGDRIHINIDNLEAVEANWVAAGRPATGGAVGTLLHELMHTLGYRHTGGEFSSDILIPGTSNQSNPNFNVASVPANRKGSVMRTAPSDMDRWQCLTGETGFQCLPQEDELILSKLYNGSCAFSTSFRNIN